MDIFNFGSIPVEEGSAVGVEGEGHPGQDTDQP